MIISRYLSKEIYSTTIVIMFILLFTLLCQQAVRYLDYVAQGKIPIDLLLVSILLEIPTLLAILVPLGLYLGILLTYRRLYVDHEMAFLQLCGMSEQRLLLFTAKIGTKIAISVLILMLWMNPWVEIKRQHIMTETPVIKHLLQTLMPKRFHTSPDGQYMLYVDEISAEHQQVKNIFLIQALNEAPIDYSPSHSILTVSKMAYWQKDPFSSSQLLIFKDGYRYTPITIDHGSKPAHYYNVIRFKSYLLHLPQQKNLPFSFEERTAFSSWLWDHYDQPDSAAELQWRVSIAIAVWILALFAVPLSRMYVQRSRYLLVVPAVIIYIGYINLLMVAKQWIEQGSIPIYIGMWWIHGIMLFLLGLSLIKRQYTLK